MRMISWTLCAAIAGMAIACGDSGKQPATAPAPPPPPPPSPAQPAPPAGGQMASAAPNDPVARGAVHYKMLCATCHGEDGCTPGPGAAGLNPQPAKHCDGNYMNKLSDEHIFKVIKEGGASVGKSPLMAPWGGTLTDDQIHDVVAFVRSLAKPPYKKQ